MSFYAGPANPRFSASEWHEVESAAAAGVFDETAWIELKKDVPAGNRDANLELARDMASLSVDGGTLLIGITDGAKKVVGVADVSALRDRLIQVAQGRISPPLFVDPVAVPNPQDSTVSVLVVSVPASASAPHMVDDRYWGRSAQGKRPLSDAEVSVLVEGRTRRRDTLESDLSKVSSINPNTQNGHGHLHVLIRPARPPMTRLTDLVHDRDVLTSVWVNAYRDGFQPSMPPLRSNMTLYVLPHPDGFLLASSTQPDADEASVLRVLLSDSGAIACVFGGGTRPFGQGLDAPETVSAVSLIELLHGLVGVAGALGEELLSYWGEWEAAVSLNRLAGILPSQHYSHLSLAGFQPYPADDYYRDTATSTREMVDRPGEVVQRLLEPLARGLGVAPRFFPYEDPNDLAKRN